MVETPKPNFFIVGAPKCGTTAMFEYLKQHPDIHLSDPKEPQFFGTDLTLRHSYKAKIQHTRDFDAYLKMFDGWRGQKRIGEGSTWYLYSKKAASEIKAFAPDAKIIIMLRQPIEMMYSLYFQNRFNLNEDLPTFEAALSAESDRREGRHIPETTYLIEALFYKEIARFSHHVERYWDVFGRENVHVIIFDDFKAEVAQSYRDTLSFLGVDPTFEAQFAVHNPNKRFRSATLRTLGRQEWIKSVGRAIVPRAQRTAVSKNFMKAVERVNTVYDKRPPLAADLRQQLQHELTPEVERLSDLLGRDLTHWVKD